MDNSSRVGGPSWGVYYWTVFFFLVLLGNVAFFGYKEWDRANFNEKNLQRLISSYAAVEISVRKELEKAQRDIRAR